jgi:hypothetical protein
MRNGHFNELCPAELERLALLSEECGEVIAIIGKILRHGYESCNPFDVSRTRNRELLEKEIGDVEYAISLLKGTDLREWRIAAQLGEKSRKIKDYLHHQAQQGAEMTTRDAAIEAARKSWEAWGDDQLDHRSVVLVIADFALQFAARTTDLARLLEAMRRDAVDAGGYSSALHVHIHADGYGYVRWGNGEIASFKTIEAGVAQLKAIIDDAEEGE